MMGMPFLMGEVLQGGDLENMASVCIAALFLRRIKAEKP